jgi:hypothetical protein
VLESVKPTVCKVVKIHKSYTYKLWIYWMVFWVVYSYLYANFLYYSYIRMRSIAMDSVKTDHNVLSCVFPRVYLQYTWGRFMEYYSCCSLLCLCGVFLLMRACACVLICSNAGFAVMDTRRCGSAMFLISCNEGWMRCCFMFTVTDAGTD